MACRICNTALLKIVWWNQRISCMNFSQLFAGREMQQMEWNHNLAYRKKMMKTIGKALDNLKAINNEFTVSSSNREKETNSMLSILKEAEAVTVNSLESLLLFIIGSKGQLKQSRWSVISNLMQPKRIYCDSEESETNEFKKVDAVLQFLISSKPSSNENFQNHMQNLELCIEDIEIGVIEIGVERLSRPEFPFSTF
ncbi:hypothetical protein SESBI_39562 [Sesbania bispinosa]|nr:hypothetical protein SESBI_39562 [Sesbania bispinosa]